MFQRYYREFQNILHQISPIVNILHGIFIKTKKPTFIYIISNRTPFCGLHQLSINVLSFIQDLIQGPHYT